MAEVLLADKTNRAELGVTVDSAGLVTRDQPADPHAVAAMAKRGLDLRPHLSRLVTDDDLTASDLVLTMATEHIVELAGRRPDAFGRMFTIRELVGRAERVGAAHAGLGSWLQRLHTGRTAMELLGAGTALDVADPLGQGRRAFERTAAELDELTDEVMALLAPGLGSASGH